MKMRQVELNETGLFLLYRAMVCETIERMGATNLLDCDLWEFTSALDMSFEDTMLYPLESWGYVIEKDLQEFVDEMTKKH